LNQLFKQMNKFPFFRQMDSSDCGATCLRMLAKYYGKHFDPQYLRDITYVTREGVSIQGLAEAAETIGFHTFPISSSFESLLKEVPLPCIAYWRERHFVIVYGVKSNKIQVADPAFGLITYTHESFREAWLSEQNHEIENEGLLILLEPTPEFYEQEEDETHQKNGLSMLLPYLRPYRSYIVQLLLGLLITSAIQLVFPFLTQAIVDQGIRYQKLDFIYLVLLAQLVLFLSRTSVQVIRRWLLLHMGSRINIALASDYLIKLMRLPIKFFDTRSTGDMFQRINDNNKIETFLSSTSLSVLFSLFSLIVLSVVLAVYHIGIFAVFMTGAIVYVSWVLIFMKRRKELDYKRFDQAVEHASNLIELTQGIQEIKLNNSEQKRRWQWESVQIKLYKIARKGLVITQYQETGAGFVNELKDILITFLSATAVIRGEMTLGMMLAVQYIIGQLNAPLLNFIDFAQQAQDARLSLSRLSDIHTQEEEYEDPTQIRHEVPLHKGIVIRGLSFRYGGPSSPWIIKNLNATLPEGKVTAIVGVSGSGKTTLLKLLLKLYNPTGGEIYVGDVQLKHLNPKSWRGLCGVVMQDGYIFNDTLARNITESSNRERIDKDRLLKAVKIANIEAFIESLPAGYQTKVGPVGTSGVNLSGGQAQRLLIARAVYKNPRFLFFDEATSALDANNEKVIIDNLQDFFQGKTVVIIAHRLSTVKNADQILVMDGGEVVEEGNHETLIQQKGKYFTLVKNQLELGN